jgi:hypothetical protein
MIGYLLIKGETVMKKTLSFLIIGILIISTIGTLASPEKSNSDKKINESIQISKPILDDENEFIKTNS